MTKSKCIDRHLYRCIFYYINQLLDISLPIKTNSMHTAFTLNSFLTIDDTRRFCGHYRSRSDCTESAV